MTLTYQKPFGPGMTPAKRDLQSVYYDLVQLQQKVAHLTAEVEAAPDRWNLSHLKARRNAVVDAEAGRILMETSSPGASAAPSVEFTPRQTRTTGGVALTLENAATVIPCSSRSTVPTTTVTPEAKRLMASLNAALLMGDS